MQSVRLEYVLCINALLKMKVAYLLGALNHGGAESLILDICRRKEHTPYDFVCIYRHDGNMSDAFKSTTVPLVQVPKKRGILLYIWALRKAFMQEKVTIVHSQTPSNTLLLSIALLGTKIQVITTFHGYNFGHAPWWQRKIVYAVSKKILCVSNHQKQYYEQKWHLPEENKLQLVYNGIDFAKIDSAKPSLDFSNLSPRIRLAMVGNFVSGRSQNIIVKSIHSLCQRGIFDFDFYFIGRRDEREAWRYDECVNYCKKQKLDNVFFLGSRGDVPSLLKTMDGFVYSTEHDTFGIAVIEAIASGLPIVVNDWTVMKEVCNLGLPNSNKAIRFFRTDDINDCAQKLQELLLDINTNQTTLHKQCKQAADIAKEKYAIQNHINQLNIIYQSL